jgi:hypothetical protein
MKILIQNSQDERVIGLGQSIKNHEILTFDPNIAVYNLIENFNQDIVVFEEGSNLKDTDIEYAKHDYPDIKFVLIKDEPQETIRDIKEELFDFIFDKSTDLPEDMEHVGNPDRRKLKYLVNEDLVCGGEYKYEYDSEFVLFTDHLLNQDKQFMDCLNWLGDTYRLKIYGPIKVDSPYYLGNPNKDEYKNIIASSKCIVMYTNVWFDSAYVNGKIPIIFSENFINDVKENYNNDFEIPIKQRTCNKYYKRYNQLSEYFLGCLGVPCQ